MSDSKFDPDGVWCPPGATVIQMKTGLFFVVSDCDAEKVKEQVWYSNGRMPFRKVMVDGKEKPQLCPKFIATLMHPGKTIKSAKHKSHNGWDCRRENLVVEVEKDQRSQAMQKNFEATYGGTVNVGMRSGKTADATVRGMMQNMATVDVASTWNSAVNKADAEMKADPASTPIVNAPVKVKCDGDGHKVCQKCPNSETFKS